MPQKRTLRTLSTQVPEHEEVEQILLKLADSDDRTAAIVGASLVESALQQRLVQSFDSRSKGLEQRLFEDRGPLSDFNSKILIPQAFAVVPDRLADDMQRIRKIRNCFAHARIDVRFDEPLIAKEVAELVAVTAARKAYSDTEVGALYQGPKLSFGLSCYITYSMLRSEKFARLMRTSTSDPASGKPIFFFFQVGRDSLLHDEIASGFGPTSHCKGSRSVHHPISDIRSIWWPR